MPLAYDPNSEPVPTVYPPNPYSAPTWITWFAGQKGDAGDQAINFAAGFADNVTFNASYAWRQGLGTDTVDYDSTAYTAGGVVATVVQLPAGVKAVAGGVKNIVALTNSFDDMGRCANILTKLRHGGCFVAGTLVTLSELPRGGQAEHALWSETDWIDDAHWESASPGSPSAVAVTPSATLTKQHMLVPIEQVPIGARVPTKNPKRWEVDDSLPEPDEATWALVKLTITRDDGAVIDAELIRPKAWIQSAGIQAGKLLPLNIAELEVAGEAVVTAIEPCPPIASGEGSVVTARFLTREVHTIVRAEILGPNGEIETIEGTPVHPIWSEDREELVPLGELRPFESIRSSTSQALVVKSTILRTQEPVFNIEVDREHVYAVGKLGLLVHNAVPDCVGWVRSQAMVGERLLIRGQGNQLLKFPGYAVSCFHHAFIRVGDKMFDVIHTTGTSFNGWIKQVARLNNKSVDEVMEMVGKLTDDVW